MPWQRPPKYQEQNRTQPHLLSLRLLAIFEPVILETSQRGGVKEDWEHVPETILYHSKNIIARHVQNDMHNTY